MELPLLIAIDLDGTLLDGAGRLPAQYPGLAARAGELGVTLAPASGRQLATLRQMFPDHGTFLAENGSVVVHEGEIVGTTAMSPERVRQVFDASARIDTDHLMVVCTPEMAYIPPAGAGLPEVEKYYKALTVVEDFEALMLPGAEVIKIAVFSLAGAEAHALGPLNDALGTEVVALSGAHWVDVSAPGANKGAGLRQLAERLGVGLDRTLAFGDFLNDYELLRAAGTAVAMDNAHPKLKAIADRIAPANTDHGVIRVLEELLA